MYNHPMDASWVKYHFCRVLPGYLVVLFENPCLRSIDHERPLFDHVLTTFKYFTCSSSFKRILLTKLLHPGRLTWNIQITHLERKMIFPTSMIMFHVNLPGCTKLLNHPPWNDHISPASCHLKQSMTLSFFPFGGICVSFPGG